MMSGFLKMLCVSNRLKLLSFLISYLSESLMLKENRTGLSQLLDIMKSK